MREWTVPVAVNVPEPNTWRELLAAIADRPERRIAIQEYTMGEAAGILGMSLRSCIVLYRQALDRTTRLFLGARILTPQQSCQEGWAG